MKFAFSIAIVKISPFNESEPIEEITGEVEADDHDTARERANRLALARARTIQGERGGTIGYRNVRLQMKEDL
jgi:hypothetical protein